jgi:ATP-dependent DNA helicase PIF1
MNPQEISLNEQQQEIYNEMKAGTSMFITGPSGSGKSELVKKFYRDATTLNKPQQKGNSKNNNNPDNIPNIALTSTTGISAFNIGGITLHSFLGIGLGTGTFESLYTKLSKSFFYRSRWVHTQILIIDEISMLDPDLFDKIEKLARKIRRNEFPFGGMQIIATGDFCQLPCVGSDKFCFDSLEWKNVIKKVFYLQKIIRQTDPIFQECLNEIRIGKPSKETMRIIKSCIGKELEVKNGIKPTVMYSLKINVDNINKDELEKLVVEKGVEIYQYEMEVIVNKKYKGDILVDTERFLKNARPNRILELCVGAQVICIYNLHPDLGIVNGSRGVVVSFGDSAGNNDIPIVRFLNGTEIPITYQSWDVMDPVKKDTKIITFEQIPLKLAWATTIHSSQGLTLDYIKLSVNGIFEFGQFYVGISRAKTLDGLSIMEDFGKSTIKAHPDALKFYREILDKSDQ